MKKGQSLVEVLVAIGIATLLGVALLSTAVLTQKASKSAQNTAYATKMEQEMLEELRIFRDQSKNKLNAFPFNPLVSPPLQPGYSICETVTFVKDANGNLIITQNVNGDLQWTFTTIVAAGSAVTCPAPPNVAFEDIYSNKVDFYRYVLFKKDIVDLPNGKNGTGLTATVFVSWQEQSGLRTIADDVYLTKWCGASDPLSCGP